MTYLRKTFTAVLAAATLSTTAYFAAPAGTANAGGYYSQGNGYYGRPYYGGHRRKRHCWYNRVPYRWDYYGNPIRWRKVRQCGYR